MAWTGPEVEALSPLKKRALMIRTRVAHREIRKGALEGLDALEMIIFPPVGLLKASEEAAIEELAALEESRLRREAVA